MKKTYPADYGPCRYCKVGAGQPCWNMNFPWRRSQPTRTTKVPHPERVRDNRNEVAQLPVVTLPSGDEPS